MGVALVGLVGALLGSAIAVLGAGAAERRKNRRDEVKWCRDQRVAAYDGALRHLLRALNLRSGFLGGDGGAVLKSEHQREWFDDLVQAQFWLRSATQYCDQARLASLMTAAGELDSYIERLVSAERFDQKGFSISAVLTNCISVVTEAARADAGMTTDHAALALAKAPTHNPMLMSQRIRAVGDGTVYAVGDGMQNIRFLADPEQAETPRAAEPEVSGED